MKPIIAQVIDITLLGLEVTLNPLYSEAEEWNRIEGFQGVTFHYSIDVDDFPAEYFESDEDDGLRYFLITMGFHIDSTKDEKQFPVVITCDMGGVVTTPSSINPEESRYFAALHGSAIVFGAIRQKILDATAMMACGKLVLPTMSLAEDVEVYKPKSLAKQISATKKRASRAKSPKSLGVTKRGR